MKNSCGWTEINEFLGFNPPYWQYINNSCRRHDIEYEAFLADFFPTIGYVIVGEFFRLIVDVIFLVSCFHSLRKVPILRVVPAAICFIIYFILIRLFAWYSFFGIKYKK
jgi:hypothetical protein